MHPIIPKENQGGVILVLTLMLVAAVWAIRERNVYDKSVTNERVQHARAVQARFAACGVIQSYELNKVIEKLFASPVLEAKDQKTLEDFDRACGILTGRK